MTRRTPLVRALSWLALIVTVAMLVLFAVGAAEAMIEHYVTDPPAGGG